MRLIFFRATATAAHAAALGAPMFFFADTSHVKKLERKAGSAVTFFLVFFLSSASSSFKIDYFYDIALCATIHSATTTTTTSAATASTHAATDAQLI